MAVEPGFERTRHIALADRAHLALSLGHDDIGAQNAQGLGIDAVDGERFAQEVLQLPVDGGARQAHVHPRLGERRQPPHRRREIALVRASDEMRFHPQRAHDLGAAAEQRHDAHGCLRPNHTRRRGFPRQVVPGLARDAHRRLGFRTGRLRFTGEILETVRIVLHRDEDPHGWIRRAAGTFPLGAHAGNLEMFGAGRVR